MTIDTAGEAQGRAELIATIKQDLEAGGTQVEVAGVMQGASGARHTFDLIAARGGKRIPVDVRLSRTGQLQLGAVLETYAKSLDVNARPAVIVTMPMASSDARKSASAFGLVLVEGSSVADVLERLNRALNQFPG